MIEVKNVSKSFGKCPVLKEISFTIDENKIIGLLGRNGVGKTTLLNLMTNRLFMDQGTIQINGENIVENDAALSQMYVMSQEQLLPESMKVGSLLYWTKEFYPTFDVKRAERLCDKFKLDTKKRFRTLSTGYQSICKIILALSSGAPILILDEPILGLDAAYREKVYEELMVLYSEQPCTIVIATHLIDEIAHLIEDVIILKDTQVLTSGDVETVLNCAYTISGLEEQVEQFIQNREVISRERLGAFSGATIIGSVTKEVEEEVNALGLYLSSIDLQKLFVYLTEEEVS